MKDNAINKDMMCDQIHVVELKQQNVCHKQTGLCTNYSMYTMAEANFKNPRDTD